MEENLTKRIASRKMWESYTCNEAMKEKEANKYICENAGIIVESIDWTRIIKSDEVVEMGRELNKYEYIIISNAIELNNLKLDYKARHLEFSEKYLETIEYSYLRGIRDLLRDNEREPETYAIAPEILELGKKIVGEHSNTIDSKKKTTVINATHQKLKKYNLKIGQEFESRKALCEWCGITKKQAASWAKRCWITDK